MEEKSLFYATFAPALTVTVAEQKYVMNRTNKYATLAELLTACAKFADVICAQHVKMGILRESADHRSHQYM